MKANSAWFAGVLMALLHAIPCMVLADDVATLASTFGVQARVEPLEMAWQKLTKALQYEEVRGVETAVGELNALRVNAGLRNLSQMSLALIEEAPKHSAEVATLLIQASATLSPTHPMIAYRLLTYGEETPSLDALWPLISGTVRTPSLLVPVCASIFYPLLFALTFGFILSGFFHLMCSSIDVLRPFYRAGRPYKLQYIAVFSLIPLFVISVAIGLLGVVVFLALVLASHEKWFLGIGGALFIVWGCLLPVQENFEVWNRSEHVQALLRVSEGDRALGDRQLLEEFFAFRPNDPLLLASLSVLFRQYGDYGAAKKVLALLEGRFGEVGWLLRERGTIEYLLGESAAAEDLLDRARESGASSPELLFMLSKVKFDLLKTEESQEVFSEARESDPARVNELERLEQLYGEKNELGLPKSIFPAQLYFDSAIEPLPQAWEQQSRRSQLLLRGMGAPQIASMGVVLMLMFLISPWLFSADREVYYLKNRDGVRFVSLLPGGLLVAAGRPIISWFFTTFFAVTLFVVFGWPNGVASFFSHHPEVTGWATGALLLVLASSYVLGWLFFQREEI